MKYLIVLFFIYLAPSMYAQNTTDNLYKYWTYRDRLRKNFLKVGNGPGESIPMSARSIGFPYSGGDSLTSRVYWQDTDIYIGHYLSVLATETKLLLNAYNGTTDISEGQLILAQLEQSKNELYYTIQTLNRLDLWAENYLSQNLDPVSVDDVNGLIMRDDVPSDFYDQFQNDYSPIFNRDCNFVTTDSEHSRTEQYGREEQTEATLRNCGSLAARPAGYHSEYQCGNVMSIGQLTFSDNPNLKKRTIRFLRIVYKMNRPNKKG
jgi:hypothetical protein